MFDILIRDATVVDGSGGALFQADVGVADGRIAAVGQDLSHDGGRAIEAQGLHLAPGFIDPHAHSDLTLLVDPCAQSKIRQGVTTEVIGNCGFSVAPLQGAAETEVRARADLLGVEITWTDFAGYLERLSSPGTALNVVPVVGHNTIRGAILGYGDVQPGPVELTAMEGLVCEAMVQGARGLSTGLFYPPGHYALTGEVVALARVAARHGGTYFSHVRSESDRGLAAIAEAVEIGRHAHIAVQIAHLKLTGYRNWPKVDGLVALLEDSVRAGMKGGADQYPYNASSCWLAAMLPYWAQGGGAKAVAERLGDDEFRARLRRDWADDRAGWENRTGVREWGEIVISECEACPEALGRSVVEIAEESRTDPLDASFDLILRSEGQVSCVWHGQSEEVVRTLMQLPFVGPGSDGYALSPEGVLGRRMCHPRSYGTFPRVLGKYVRDEGVLTLEEAVRKMTAMPADRFGLTGRGRIREGGWADLVLFDAATVADRATFTDPHQYPTGISHVVVNGQIVIDGGRHTGTLPGRVLSGG